MQPHYTVIDIQIGVGDHEFNKGLALFTKDAVQRFEISTFGYQAQVKGSKPGQWYDVSVAASDFDRGHCTCYLGQNDQLCKHMIAVAIAAVHKERPKDATPVNQPLDWAVCSGEVREITDVELQQVKADVTAALRHIKSYSGPSSTWFAYQNSLTKGCRQLLLALSNLPVCERSALVCIDVLKRLDRKLLRSVDDSDGTVGDTMMQVVELLNLFVSEQPELREYIAKRLPKGEVFDYETGFQLFNQKE